MKRLYKKVEVIDYKILAEYLFRSKSLIYSNKPVVNLESVCKKGKVPFNNNTVSDWAFDKVNPFFPYVMVVSENNTYYNVMMPGVKGLRKLKKKLVLPEYLPIFSEQIKRYFWNEN